MGKKQAKVVAPVVPPQTDLTPLLVSLVAISVVTIGLILAVFRKPQKKSSSARPAKERVVLVGSGNWGSAIATKIGQNVEKDPRFHPEVKMWVFEEYVKLEKTAKGDQWIRPARGSKPPEGKTWVDVGFRPLTEVINERHENVIYLPGIPLPKSIVAEPDIHKAVTDATMMIFVIPHNFLAPIVPKMNGAFAKEAIGIVSDPREAAARARAVHALSALHSPPPRCPAERRARNSAVCVCLGRRSTVADQRHRV